MLRILLNILFIGFILFSSANNNDKNLPLAFIVLYNMMLFVPAWVNNFWLLPDLRKTKKIIPYLISVIAAFLFQSW
ncbi:hypothetical protein EG345_05925 [Chryseobacterium carnipullorum]|nr:hypothetical protein EG345_05925 [Chryseobacterium carnipullorum]